MFRLLGESLIIFWPLGVIVFTHSFNIVICSRLSILCCHLVCGGGETKSPCKSYAGKKRTKKDAWRLFEKLESLKNLKVDLQGDLQHPLEPSVAKANMLPHVALWPMAIKLNPSWKTEVCKSNWIKSWLCFHVILGNQPYNKSIS